MKNFMIVTVATEAVLPELRALRWSVNEFLGVPLLVAGDKDVGLWVDHMMRAEVATLDRLDFVRLPEAFDLKRAGYAKTFAIRQGLARVPQVLYVDVDVLFLGDWLPRLKPGVTMAMHKIAQSEARQFGYWNSGYIGVTREGAAFCDWWDAAPKEVAGAYGDQQCLDACPHRTAAFPDEHDVGWWRWTAPEGDRPEIKPGIDAVLYNHRPLVSIHTHLIECPDYRPDNYRQAAEFNHTVFQAMRGANSKPHRDLLAKLAQAGRFNEFPESQADVDARLNTIELIGMQCLAEGKLREAADCFARLTGTPRAAPAFNNLAACCRQMGDVARALKFCRRALELGDPGDPQRWTYERNVAGLLLLCGQNDLAGALFAQSKEHAPPEHAHEPWSSSVFTALCGSDAPELTRANAKAWGEAQYPDAPRARQPGKMRVGYLSRDFGPHPVGQFIEPVIAHHGADIETYLYSAKTYAGNARHERMKLRAGARWFNVEALSDDELECLVKADDLDVLVELGGHSGESRIRVLRRRMARTQLSYLGYPATTGLRTIDAKIVDEITDPPGSESEYVERLIRLPRCYVAWQPEETSPPVGAPADGPPIFGCFSSANKLSLQCVELFAAVLKSVPDARLMLKNQASAEPESRARFNALFSAAGVDASRIEWATVTRTREEHLERYAGVHVALDTFPYNCTTTTCEALWQGVPVVSLSGRTHRSRNGASLLNALGIHSMAALPSVNGFVSLAIAAARSEARTISDREALRERMRESQLCDTAGLALALEAEYRKLAGQ
mgnify:CR=1 FL=1